MELIIGAGIVFMIIFIIAKNQSKLNQTTKHSTTDTTDNNPFECGKIYGFHPVQTEMALLQKPHTDPKTGRLFLVEIITKIPDIWVDTVKIGDWINFKYIGTRDERNYGVCELVLDDTFYHLMSERLKIDFKQMLERMFIGAKRNELATIVKQQCLKR